jgi:hypothetical protein
MDDVVAAIIGIAIMVGFAGGLAWLIGAPPLVLITVVVLAMAVTDVWRTLREQARDRGS